MRKIWWILIASFFVGILVCGLGVGITFAEFSNLTYAGEKEIGDMVEETLVYEVATDADNYNICTTFHIEPGQNIISDNSLPENRIEIDVTYNNETDEPFLYDCYWETNEEVICDIYVSNAYDGFQVFMEHKDEILTDLKNNRIGSYRIKDDGYDIVVRCNPAVADKILVQ